jgi:hypothetical protein
MRNMFVTRHLGTAVAMPGKRNFVKLLLGVDPARPVALGVRR